MKVQKALSLLLLATLVKDINSLSSTTPKNENTCIEQTNRRKFIKTIAGASLTSGILLNTNEEDVCNASTAEPTTPSISEILGVVGSAVEALHTSSSLVFKSMPEVRLAPAIVFMNLRRLVCSMHVFSFFGVVDDNEFISLTGVASNSNDNVFCTFI